MEIKKVCGVAWKCVRLPLLLSLIVGCFYLSVEIYEKISYDLRVAHRNTIWTELICPTVRIDVIKEGRCIGVGSGTVIYSQRKREDEEIFDTYILSCSHIYPEDFNQSYHLSIRIWSPQKSKYVSIRATRVASSVPEESDLSILKLHSTNWYYTASIAPKEIYETISIFDCTYTIGSIYGQEIYSFENHITQEPKKSKYGRTSGPIYSGFSGGGCFLAKGNYLIGVNVMTKIYPNGPFAINVDTVAMFVPLHRIIEWIDSTGHDFLYKGQW